MALSDGVCVDRQSRATSVEFKLPCLADVSAALGGMSLACISASGQGRRAGRQIPRQW
ncbi:hypothetical protein GGTG_10736 [Gaeumannomyces tritici R3-111a-1]|uniref:Uncharacterized protein n=1 Tax=Gaeumannomyces tritici (strain R3-111a-1) TaxID=644352 RepID=J3PB63_GAET3|nr:hypothetical protein GGTG_10736 [Gaeumannomyces tritici R3-111a-1]EJT71479.1 hypothetical protein GGTG_10736 [Gaeumannomyces tritici R3-111a-1]